MYRGEWHDVGRMVGGGFRIGNSCIPVVDSCQCMAKSIQYCKVKKKKRRMAGYSLWGHKELDTTE